MRSFKRSEEKNKRYKEYVSGLDRCPMCYIGDLKGEIVERSDKFYLWRVAKEYQYDGVEDHLLLIPYDHVTSYNDLTWEAKKTISYIFDIFNEKHPNSYIIMRNQKSKSKSIDHLHIHLIVE